MRFVLPISVLTAVSGSASSQQVSKHELNRACNIIAKQVGGHEVNSYCKGNPVKGTAVCHGILHREGKEGFEGFELHSSSADRVSRDPVSCEYAVQFLKSLELAEELASLIEEEATMEEAFKHESIDTKATAPTWEDDSSDLVMEPLRSSETSSTELVATVTEKESNPAEESVISEVPQKREESTVEMTAASPKKSFRGKRLAKMAVLAGLAALGGNVAYNNIDGFKDIVDDASARGSGLFRDYIMTDEQKMKYQEKFEESFEGYKNWAAGKVGGLNEVSLAPLMKYFRDQYELVDTPAERKEIVDQLKAAFMKRLEYPQARLGDATRAASANGSAFAQWLAGRGQALHGASIEPAMNYFKKGYELVDTSEERADLIRAAKEYLSSPYYKLFGSADAPAPVDTDLGNQSEVIGTLTTSDAVKDALVRAPKGDGSLLKGMLDDLNNQDILNDLLKEVDI